MVLFVDNLDPNDSLLFPWLLIHPIRKIYLSFRKATTCQLFFYVSSTNSDEAAIVHWATDKGKALPNQRITIKRIGLEIFTWIAAQGKAHRTIHEFVTNQFGSEKI